MTTEHDEALVERVALAICNATRHGAGLSPYKDFDGWSDVSLVMVKGPARAVIYPPAPPKTRLQVARELLAKGYEWRDERENNPSHGPSRSRSGLYDNNAEIHAILAALALPAMED